MLTFLKKDEFEAAKIARRRKFETERKERIFNPRARLFGVDVKGLEEQLHEKQKKNEQELREQEDYAKQKIQEARIALELEARAEHKKRDIEKNVQEFRDLFQQPRDRREFELNDPNYIKNAVVAQNGVTVFEGEDLTKKARTEKQQKQTKAWLLQQIEEKNRLENEQKCLNADINQKWLSQEKRAKQLAYLEDQCRRKLEESTAEYNKKLAEERAAEKRIEAERDSQVKAQELENWLTGDFLNENPNQARSAFGPNRVIPYSYKGDPPEKVVETKRDQIEQAHEKKIREEQELAELNNWAAYERTLSGEASRRFNEFMRRQRELDGRFVEINESLAQEHRLREREKNNIRELYPTRAFFDQFNRSTY